MRPLLLLDVDGMLSPHAARGPLPGYVEHSVGYRVSLNPAHGPMLLAFAARHDVELVWATILDQDANDLIGPLIGLPELPVLVCGEHPEILRSWKYPAVLDYAGERPLAWLDDDFHTEDWQEDQEAFLEARGATPTLLRYVDPAVGFTRWDLTVTGTWLRKISR